MSWMRTWWLTVTEPRPSGVALELRLLSCEERGAVRQQRVYYSCAHDALLGHPKTGAYVQP